jgi:hypothetical protein
MPDTRRTPRSRCPGPRRHRPAWPLGAFR